MVGFGKFLGEVSSQHGVAKHSFDYHKMKEELARLVGSRSESESEPGLVESDAESVSVATDPDEPQPTAAEFIEKLEDEMYRVNTIVKQKLKALQRVRKVLDSARHVRGFRAAQQNSIVLMQLSNVYDDVILVLWFMYLNSIAVSKLVKKYNKNMPNDRYTIDPSRWLFLHAGLSHAQKAKASVEAEFAACIEMPDGSAALLAERNSEVSELAKSMKQLMQEYKHHLFRHGDPTDWAVLPHLPSAKGTTMRKPSRHLAEDTITINAPKLKEEFSIGPVVGRGAYGVVCKATHIATSTPAAIKTVYDAWTHPILAQRTYRELFIMQQLSHPNILPLTDLFISANQRDVHMILPFVPHTCEDLLAKRQLVLRHKKWFVLHLFSALSYLHSRGVVHRDLKLSNILVDDQPVMYLSDFGLARTLAGGSETTTFDNPDYVQTQWYRAPEVLLCSRKTTPAADMWSAGCVLAELLTGVPLFPGQDDQQQLELIMASCPVPKNSLLTEEVRRHLKLGEPDETNQSSNGDTDTCEGTSRKEEEVDSESADVASQDERPEQPAVSARSEDVMEHMQQVQVTSELGGLRRGSRNFLPKRRLEDVVHGCWKLGVQEPFAADTVMDLLKKLLQFEPSKRLTSAQALTHPWFLSDEPLPEQSIQDAIHAAVPKHFEGDVILGLPCTTLHSAAAYREAVQKGPQVPTLRMEQQERISHHENALLIQRFWRWKRRGAERPVLMKGKARDVRKHEKPHKSRMHTGYQQSWVHGGRRQVPERDYSHPTRGSQKQWWDCSRTPEVACSSCNVM